MNEEVKQRWIDTLLSGRFKQGRDRLCTVEPPLPGTIGDRYSFCCLGVLCELAVESGIPIEKTLADRQDGSGLCMAYAGQLYYLPPEVQEWAGMKDHTGGMPDEPDPIVNSLGQRNDKGASFEEIATVIKERF